MAFKYLEAHSPERGGQGESGHPRQPAEQRAQEQGGKERGAHFDPSTPSGEANHPAPTRAPVSARVVEIGMPIRVINSTVAAAANTTAREKLGSATTASGTRSLPLKTFSEFLRLGPPLSGLAPIPHQQTLQIDGEALAYEHALSNVATDCKGGVFGLSTQLGLIRFVKQQDNYIQQAYGAPAMWRPVIPPAAISLTFLVFSTRKP